MRFSFFVFRLDVSSHNVVGRKPILVEKLLAQTECALTDGEPHVSGRTGVVVTADRSSVFSSRAHKLSDCG